jgi:uncharacterized membrane protein
VPLDFVSVSLNFLALVGTILIILAGAMWWATGGDTDMMRAMIIAFVAGIIFSWVVQFILAVLLI